MNEKAKGHAVGVGGVFFRSKDPAQLGAWFADPDGNRVEFWQPPENE